MQATLEYHSDFENSHKFYESTVLTHADGSATHVMRWGRVHGSGQTKIERYASEQAAIAAHNKKLSDKLGKGYETISERTFTFADFDLV